MIIRYISVLFDAPEVFFILIGAFTVSMLVGLTFHEFSHAFVADSLGDGTPRRFGRVSLNPKRHLDPVGSTMIFFAGFGWAKPVPINPGVTANPKKSLAMIALAGPVSNLAVAGVAAIPIRMGWIPAYHPFIHPANADLAVRIWTENPQALAGLFLGTIVFLNVLLAVFNLLPISPLDGFNAAVGLLPHDLSRQLAQTAPWGLGILMLLIFLPFISGGQFTPLSTVMSPLIDFFLNLFFGTAVGFRFG